VPDVPADLLSALRSGTVAKAAAQEPVEAPARSPADSPRPAAEGPSTGPAVEAASFKGVTPGVTTLDEVAKAWGPPKSAVDRQGSPLHLYRVDPFDRVEVGFLKNKVTSIVIRLDRSFPAAAVARQLDLGDLKPVLVSSPLGEILGQSFPERGVLFAFEPASPGSKSTTQVAQIILEPISAEPFVLRAETNLDGRPEACLADLDQAVKLSPDNARAHWLRARVLLAQDDLTRAAAAIDEAVRLEPDNARFHVTRSQILGHAGRFAEAMAAAERAVKTADTRPHVKARALCLLGDLAGSGTQPDYRKALACHTDAIKTADPLINSPYAAVRLPAKEVLIDAHLGATHDIAWGPWNRKEPAMNKWLVRAAAVAEDMIQNEKASQEYRFRVAARALTAYVGIQGKLDPGSWVEQVSKAGQAMIAAAPDTAARQQIQWDLGMALYDAVQLYQLRRENETALREGRQAVEFLRQGLARRADSPSDNYVLGRLYFRIGALHAAQPDHRAATSWFDKALPVLDRALGRIDPAEKGRLGETLVSMAVSYWETGERDRALEMTTRGVGLMEDGAKDRPDPPALDIAYSNLSSMYRRLGRLEEAKRYQEKAKNAETLRR
jgi:tetratricopeptide (TPR) repeat protein